MRNRLYIADKAGSRGKEQSPCRNCPEAVYSKGFGVPEVIRTPDLPLRRRSLYPAELRKHITIVIISQFCNFVKCLFDKKSWLAIATSIDALAVGITFAFLNIFLEGVGILK